MILKPWPVSDAQMPYLYRILTRLEARAIKQGTWGGGTYLCELSSRDSSHRLKFAARKYGHVWFYPTELLTFKDAADYLCQDEKIAEIVEQLSQATLLHEMASL